MRPIMYARAFGSGRCGIDLICTCGPAELWALLPPDPSCVSRSLHPHRMYFPPVQ